MNGKRGGDPAKLARALLTIVDPGAAAVPVHCRRQRGRAGRAEARRTRKQIDDYRELSRSLTLEEEETAA
jgi:uncharacterized protein (DUF849 family)